MFQGCFIRIPGSSMPSSPFQESDLLQIILPILQDEGFIRGSFAGAKRGKMESPWERIKIRPVEIRGVRHWQQTMEGLRKSHSTNFSIDTLNLGLQEILTHRFANIHMATTQEEIDIRIAKKGKILINRSRIQCQNPTVSRSHNRIKEVPLPEGETIRLLEIMGIMTPEGKVRPTMRSKYTQINEFLKLLAHVLEAEKLQSLNRELQILDCGCGLSYLTLAVHHYLNEKLHIPCQMIGVDVNEEVIRKSIERSHQLGQHNIQFACNPIGLNDARPDIVLALHACNTSSDDAIALAVRCQARILLCVPCCHHDLNEKIRAQGPTTVLRPVLRHGILHQRIADQLTDAFRALILRIMGYRTDIIEFISPEHTSRNLMIRAVQGLPRGEKTFLEEYEALCQFWGVRPYLETALGTEFQEILSGLGRSSG